MKKLLFSAIFLGIFVSLGAVSPHLAHALTVKAANELTIAADETITDNAYIASGNAVIDGTVQGDLVLGAGTARVQGTVSEDVIVLGQDVYITGTVLGDVRVLSGVVTIDGAITGDVLALAGKVHLTENAAIQGDIVTLGGTVESANSISQDARLIGGRVLLAGEITHPISVTAERVTVADTARIANTVTYFSPREADIADTADISGEVTYHHIEAIQDNGIIERAAVSFLNFWIVLRFITTLLLTFLLVYVFRVFSQKTAEFAIHSFPMTFLVGFLSLFAMPLAAVIFFISLILIPVSLLTMLAYVFVGVLASAVAGIVVGAIVKRAFSKDDEIEVSFNTAALGVVLLTVVQFVPYIGDPTRIIFMIVAFGAIWRYIYEGVRHPEASLFKRN